MYMDIHQTRSCAHFTTSPLHVAVKGAGRGSQPAWPKMVAMAELLPASTPADPGWQYSDVGIGWQGACPTSVALRSARMDCKARRALEHHLRAEGKEGLAEGVIVTCRRMLRHINTIWVRSLPPNPTTKRGNRLVGRVPGCGVFILVRFGKKGGKTLAHPFHISSVSI